MGQVSVTTEGATRESDNVTGLCHRFGMCHASVRQMSQVWHVMRQMSQVWHVSWRLCVRCHGVRASDVMSRNVKTAAASPGHGALRRSARRVIQPLFGDT